MASTNRLSSFTITQPFLGAPLQFSPALGSQELEELIDAFVTGSASKQDKLSEVTIDFYNHATVDLNTGALVRRYDVLLSSWTGNAFEQSPTQSQSSGFSPAIYTPSPTSSAMLGDSGYGSISMTPPNRARNARVSKKPRKETKKAAEVRLPGFSIMTKDGVDVTSSAGRGTKTKEQREHAHLMRIMKACDECKRKKIKVSLYQPDLGVQKLTCLQCDPSHRRPHTEMSRSSTSTTKSSSSRQNPSPSISTPSLSRETTRDSQESLPSYGTNAIDDFVLFPEDTPSWNPTDMSFPEFDNQGCDLGNFNFDNNDIDLNDFPTMTADRPFDFTSFDQPGFPSGYTPFSADQYGLDQWAEPQGFSQVSHTPPHPPTSAQDSRQLDTMIYGGVPGLNSSTSPQVSGAGFVDNSWPNFQSSNMQLSGSSGSPSGFTTNTSPTSSSPLSSLDWSMLDSSANQSPVDSSSPGISLTNRKDRRSLKRRQSELINELVDSVPSRRAPEAPADMDSPGIGASRARLDSSDHYSLSRDSPGFYDIESGNSSIEHTCALVAEIIQASKSAPAVFRSLSGELARLHATLDNVKLPRSRGIPLDLPDHVVSLLDTLTIELQVILTRVKMVLAGRQLRQRFNKLDPDFHPDFLRQCQVHTRRLVRSLCAIIPTLQAQGDGSALFGNASNLSTAFNKQLLAPSCESKITDTGEQVTLASGGSLSSNNSGLRDSRRTPMTEALLKYSAMEAALDGDIQEQYSSDGSSVALTTREASRYAIVKKYVVDHVDRPRLNVERELPTMSSSLALSLEQADNLSQPPNSIESQRASPGFVSKAQAVAANVASFHASPSTLPLESFFDQTLTVRTVGVRNTVESLQSTSLRSEVISLRGATPLAALDHNSSRVNVHQETLHAITSQPLANGSDMAIRVFNAFMLFTFLHILSVSLKSPGNSSANSHGNLHPLSWDSFTDSLKALNGTSFGEASTLPYIIAAIVLATSLPHAITSSLPPLNNAMVLGLGLIFVFGSSLQVACSQWPVNGSFATFAKLALCCFLVASPSTISVLMDAKPFNHLAFVASLLTLSTCSSRRLMSVCSVASSPFRYLLTSHSHRPN
jgi:hypothetical protein